MNVVETKLNANPNPYPDGAVMTKKVKDATAAGTTQSTGTALAGDDADVYVVTNNSSSNGVVLPANVKGKELIIIGSVAEVTKVYPPVGGKINYGSANAAVSLVANKPGYFIAVDDLNWVCVTDTDTPPT